MSEKKDAAGAKAEQQREFQPVNENDARRFLREAVKSVASAMIWTKEQKQIINSNIRMVDETTKTMHVWVPTGIDPAVFVAELGKIGSHDCFFSISLSRANIFFKATCMGHDENGFRFRLPEKLFKVQRRKDMRLLVPYTHVVRVEVPDPLFPDQKLSKKIFDISAGGISFVVSDEESATFQPELEIKNVAFSVRSRKIKVDGVVRHMKAQPEGSTMPGVKIGFQFTRIDKGDAAWIGAYVFEETRKSVSNFL